MEVHLPRTIGADAHTTVLPRYFDSGLCSFTVSIHTMIHACRRCTVYLPAQFNILYHAVLLVYKTIFYHLLYMRLINFDCLTYQFFFIAHIVAEK